MDDLPAPQQPADVAASLAARAALAKVRIVLVDSLLPQNIGAAARAMKTMGLAQLYLVRPQQALDGQAHRLASGASDVLDQAVVLPALPMALADCVLSFAVSARRRRIALPLDSPESAALACLATDGPIALVFGSEQAGLCNEDVLSCQRLLQIPSDHEFGSLNLAAAVQVITYELRKAALSTRLPKPTARLAPQAQFDSFLAHVLDLIGPRERSSLLAERVRRVLLRAQPSHAELRMLRGLIERLRRR